MIRLSDNRNFVMNLYQNMIPVTNFNMVILMGYMEDTKNMWGNEEKGVRRNLIAWGLSRYIKI